MEQPRFTPMQAVRSDNLPVGEEWVYETNLIGLRVLAYTSPEKSQLMTRGGHNYNTSFPGIVRQLPAAVQASQAVLDGEIVAQDKRGRIDANRRFQRFGAEIIYYAFDILELDEQPLINEPWIIRRQFLEHILSKQSNIKLSATFDQSDLPFLPRILKRKGINSVVAKRVDSLYLPSRQSKEGWLRYTFLPPQRKSHG
jgi:bifunctional non-homologous end joining protein LigD